ncbi:hypothetical protein TNCV_814741 [Trichonephila clavipes]|nr:hypothetical protein TNCV_814741 [Trichonephila clavipes]
MRQLSPPKEESRRGARVQSDKARETRTTRSKRHSAAEGRPVRSGKTITEKETPYFTTLSKKIAQGNITASCKRLISWFLLFKGTELGRKIVPVGPPKF